MSSKSGPAITKAAMLRTTLMRQAVSSARKFDDAFGEELATQTDSDWTKTLSVIVRAAKDATNDRRVPAVKVLGAVAGYAARYCGGVPDELLDAVPLLAKAASDDDESVRVAALTSLSGFGTEAGSEIIAVVTGRESSSLSTEEIEAAIHALRACGPDIAAAAVEWLATLLDRADAAELACQTLGWIGPNAARAIERLGDVAAGASRLLRRQAASALIAIDPNGKVVAKQISDCVKQDAVLMALRETGAEGRDATATLSRKWTPKEAPKPEEARTAQPARSNIPKAVAQKKAGTPRGRWPKTRTEPAVARYLSERAGLYNELIALVLQGDADGFKNFKVSFGATAIARAIMKKSGGDKEDQCEKSRVQATESYRKLVSPLFKTPPQRPLGWESQEEKAALRDYVQNMLPE